MANGEALNLNKLDKIVVNIFDWRNVAYSHGDWIKVHFIVKILFTISNSVHF